MACEPLAGKRMVKITERKTKKDWSYFIAEIAEGYKSAEKITLVMDNLNTHTPGSLYETFLPNEAKKLWAEIGNNQLCRISNRLKSLLFST